MAFGALESCPECGGFLVFNYTNYRCTGNITEWTTYSYTTNLPKRKAFEIPDRIKEDYDMFQQYKYEQRDCIIPQVTKKPKLINKIDEIKEPDYDPKLPLNGYSVALIGRLLKRKSILKKHIEQLGGAMTTNIDKTVGVVVSTQDEIKTLLSFNIDLRKMSLRKLSRNQLKIAYGVLTELQTLITSDSINKTSIIDASNRFYTRISHDFGRKKPQILNNVDFIQSKTQMIDNLLDIKIVYSIQGLRIALPEAPMTGYMFGKGVYFADMVSKSGDAPEGLMLLCEVALGRMYECYKSTSLSVDTLPKGAQSTKDCGQTTSDPKNHYYTDDGVLIPLDQ
ncbi:unnamed protein product, partial [Rotaria sordida]